MNTANQLAALSTKVDVPKLIEDLSMISPQLRSGFAAAKAGYRVIKRAKRRPTERRGYRVTPPKTKLARVGETKGSSTSKKTETIRTDLLLLDLRNLYVDDEVLNVDEEVNSFSDITRMTKQIYCSGFKCCYSIINLYDEPIYFHLAVANIKSLYTGATSQDFFRDEGRGNKRASHFDTSLSGMDMHCLPINTDKFNVLMHKKMILGKKHDISDYNSLGRANYTQGDFWLDIKRQIRFDGEGNTQFNTDKLMLLYWCTPVDAATDAPVLTDMVKFSKRVVAYWREPTVVVK